MSGRLALAGTLILVVNLPFGYWRAATRRLSVPWFVSIHVPVLLVIGIRLLLGLPFALEVLPVTVGCFALGQWLGGRVRRWRRANSLLPGRNGRD